MRNQPIGKIVFVDDDPDEKDFLEESLSQLVWDIKVLFFSSAIDALDYLQRTTDPIFAIISDINMPNMDGFQFKRAIDNDVCLVKRPYLLSLQVLLHQART
jgi:CheY-like chemotaxis protein